MSFDISIRPRVSETDMLGHINNVAVIAWLEEGRSYMIREFAQKAPAVPPFVLVRIEVDYKAQLYFGEEVRVSSAVERIGTSSAVIAQTVWQRGNRCAQARCVVVHFNHETQKSCPLPPALREGLAGHLQPTAAQGSSGD